MEIVKYFILALCFLVAWWKFVEYLTTPPPLPSGLSCRSKEGGVKWYDKEYVGGRMVESVSKGNPVWANMLLCSGCGHGQFFHHRTTDGGDICNKCFEDKGRDVGRTCQEFIMGKPVTRKFIMVVGPANKLTKLEMITIEPAARGAGWEMFKDHKPMFKEGTRFTAMQLCLNVVEGMRKGLGNAGVIKEIDPPPLRVFSSTPTTPSTKLLPPSSSSGATATKGPDETQEVEVVAPAQGVAPAPPVKEPEVEIPKSTKSFKRKEVVAQ